MNDAGLLAARDHPEPHRFLGAHAVGGDVVIRAWSPHATSITVVPDRGRPRDMLPTDTPGLFEVTLKRRRTLPAYRLLREFAGGVRHLGRDPYGFLPTLGELDLHLIGQGRHEDLYDVLGAHPRTMLDTGGVAFALWAPNASSVSVVGDFNGWDGRVHPMRTLGASGVWELFVPDLGTGERYKYEIRASDGAILMKADPMAQETETPPRTASIVHEPRHEWADDAWLERRRAGAPHREAVSIYEVHLPSWRRIPEQEDRSLSYLELADALADHVLDLGFTHVELMPIMAHPFEGSWGYQVASYFAPAPRLGSPDDLRTLIDRLHQRGLGVILDWVPAHFPRDDFALRRFDGTALYEHLDPRRGEHADWGTLIFNYGRGEVRNFLVASGRFWMDRFHADGLRVDAVASMLYLDYSRESGEWLPNEQGGRENLDAIGFLRELNEVTHQHHPGVLLAAEESTAWPGVTAQTSAGGLGFDLKWNMGWMHDTLQYFSREPIHRGHHHNDITFSLVYAFSEQFVLPLSHDEVVHGKGSLVSRMPGDRWQQFANLRALYAYMWAHPGKKLLFMGGEFGQTQEWSHERSLDWHLLQYPEHAGLMRLVGDLNAIYRDEPALWELDSDGAGFAWLVGDDAAANVMAFARFAERDANPVVCVLNLSPVPREGYRIGLPRPGIWREALNTDSRFYAGSDLGNAGAIVAEAVPAGGQPWSAELTLPPLAGLWLVPEEDV